MAFIEADGLTKRFRRPVKDPGLRGAVKHLFTRRFADHAAVDGIDLRVEAGEAVAYVGPNGAGKSTTVKLLAGILVPTAGEVRVGGVVPHRQRVANARQIGVLFGQRTQLWWDLPVRESLALLRDLYDLDAATYREQLERFDDVLGLGELLPVVARKLSLGQRMRADLAAALLHRPRVVYLDEPTIGLDIAVKDRVRAFLRELRADGTTLILTTHDLGDIEDVCQRIVIIDQGRIIYDGPLAGVKDQFARHRSMHLHLADPLPRDAVTAALPGLEVAEGATPGEFTVRFDRFAVTAGQVIAAVSALSEVRDLRIDEPAIEDVIRKVYAGELRLVPAP
ncbi:ABC transporter ATP-binding protein [Micromonospora sp. NBC_01813]|uniref:ABC transporter ATP-binding protein n=1 Tax=Micromonospora sp. NBC_01813 TaxID=2975988 RepID=UPI002DD9A195|nr:ATP-binding cassette domain-containing protein [Micromonospora sp. NBC_01813]WSA09628.1 ATP-binding cassette domain-containing protein [Micromonospora sp. NBC_01813]